MVLYIPGNVVLPISIVYVIIEQQRGREGKFPPHIILIGYRLNTRKLGLLYRSKTSGGHISPFSVYNLFIVYPCFQIDKLRLIYLKSIFKTTKQPYSVSKRFSSKHRAVIFRHSSVATTYKVPKYNELTKLGMLLMH